MGVRLWMSGEVMGDIGEDHRLADNEIEAALNEVLKARDYGEGLVEWAFLSIILSFEDPTCMSRS